MVPKMILRLGFLDLVDHIASLILARLVAFSELSAPSGGAPPEFSYIPLSHVTVSGKIAIILERASHCTKNTV